MELRDKLECLKFISQIHRSQFDERRRYEWKIVFTALTFYVLCVAAIYGGNITLPSGWISTVVVWGLSIGLAVSIATFLASLHTANNKNKTFAENAEKAIADLVEDKEPTTLSLFSLKKNIQVSWSNFFNRDIAGIWAWRWQVVTLLFFAIASAALLTLK
ncbi:MAG: hypothetical protein KAT53_07875 [Dehalococcoidia bacterium]|nr:hypothetical protein [Dehalococcoidia bacterium]